MIKIKYWRVTLGPWPDYQLPHTELTGWRSKFSFVLSHLFYESNLNMQHLSHPKKSKSKFRQCILFEFLILKLLKTLNLFEIIHCGYGVMVTYL